MGYMCHENNISGVAATEAYSFRVKRTRSLIDLCSGATQSRWVMPKHIKLAITVRHLTGSTQLISMLHRYGHCQSYNSVLELETALAYQIQRVNSILPSNISVAENAFCQMCWDNFDVYEDTPSGAGTTHSTHGIVIQEVSGGAIPVECTFSDKKSRQTSFKFSPLPVQSIFIPNKVEPSFQVSETVTDIAQYSRDSYLSVSWSVCRALFNNECTVPEWSGWLSMTASDAAVTKCSNIGYMTPIMQPITQVATVYNCLQTSVDVTTKLQQQCTFVTFDLAAAKLAFNVVWHHPDKFQRVIIHLGAFHTMCAYMGALGTMMCGSGFEDIVLEAGICASGSLNQVMSGKHYSRALRVHVHMLCALERLLLTTFMEKYAINLSDLDEMAILAQAPCFERLCESEVSGQCLHFVSQYAKYVHEVRQGLLGKTAQFWCSYRDLVWLMLTYQQAVRQNNFNLYLSSMREMCSLLFSADRLHYARYLPMYHAQLVNLAQAHPEAYSQLQNYGISVARSKVPACRIAVDMTIEQTINRSAKTAGGVIGFSRNANAYYRWCLTRHKRATYMEATLEELGMSSSVSDSHASTRPAELKRSEADVQNLVVAFQSFVNPFTVPDTAKDSLLCLSSGKPATATVTADLLNYTAQGEDAAKKFIEERLVEKAVAFHAPMKKLKLQTFVSMAVQKTVSTSKQKTVCVKAERNLMGRLLLLSQEHDISLPKLFKHPLSPVQWSLATPDGHYTKTDKAQLLHILEAEAVKPSAILPLDTVHIVDGNALLQSMTNLPATFGDLALAVFNCLPKKEVVHFVTDSYFTNSIKDIERARRGQSSTYIVAGSKTKLPKDFGKFLHDADNKKQLISFLGMQWREIQYAPLLQERYLYFVCEENCVCLHSDDGITVDCSDVAELRSTQEEADTRIILHSIYAARSGAGSVVVRSPDTDVFILLIGYSSAIQIPILFDTGTGNKRRLIDISSIASSIGANLAEALVAFHAFTGCDTTSAFARKGKRSPLAKMRKNDMFVSTFSQLGLTPDNVEKDLLKGLESFVCAIYGKPRQNSVNMVRWDIFQSRYSVRSMEKLSSSVAHGIDLSLLPPCQNAFLKHCLRANYQSYIWRHAHVACPPLPSPVGCGWKSDAEGKLQVDWFDGEIMPPQLIDILEGDSPTDDDALTEETVEEEDVIDNIIDVIFEDD